MEADPTVNELTHLDYNDIHHEDEYRVRDWFESGRRSLCYYRAFCHKARAWHVAVAWAEPAEVGTLLIVASVELGVWGNVVDRGLADDPVGRMMPGMACAV